MSLKLLKEGETMSVLLAGQDDAQRRYLKGRYEQKLTKWFAEVEDRAWDWVNGLPRRPNYIFYVTGQSLVSEYAISHIENKSSSCSFSFEAAAAVSSVADVSFLLRHEVKRISASAGFEVIEKKMDERGKPRLYSVFLEANNSYPSKLMGKSPDYARVLNVYA
jgi:hypothetical protein